MGYFNAKEFSNIWDDFCSHVLPNGPHVKIDYKTYRQIQRAINNAKSTDFFEIQKTSWGYQLSASTLDSKINFAITDNSFGTYLYQNMLFESKQIIKENEENDKKMNMTNPNYKNNNNSIKFDFGPMPGDSVRMSVYGLAIRNKNGIWVAYDKNKRQIIDVDIFNVNSNGMYYKMPVPIVDVKVGDLVVHNDWPCYVISLKTEGAMYAFEVMDINDSIIKTIVPTTNMFNFNYMTKIVSLLDMGNFVAPNENNPFGGMLPLMLLGENANATDILMLMALQGQMGDINPWMLMALNGNGNNSLKNILPILALTNMNKQKIPNEQSGLVT